MLIFHHSRFDFYRVRTYNIVHTLMKNYLVSIIIPVYNGANYVAKALESAVNQTYKNLEIIVINDGSKDEGATKKAVEPFLEDKRVTYIEKENGGVSSVLNFGIKYFKGDFFVWLSHDDMFHPKSIELRLEKWIKLGENPKTIISTETKYIDENGKNKFRVAAKGKNVNNIYDIVSSVINGCSLLLPREAIQGHEFIQGMVYMQDYYLWGELIEEGCKIVCIKKKITYNRIHSKQITAHGYEILKKDFSSFEARFISKLLEKKDYKQIKKIVYAFTRRLSVRPFYQEFIDKYIKFLKDEKKWNVFNSCHLLFDRCISLVVKILRRGK